VTVPPQAKERLRTTAGPGSSSRAILRIEGVEVPSDRGALINVYLNRPEATAATGTNDPGYVGSIALVAAQAPGSGHAHTVVRNFGFDITGKLAESLGRDDIAVTLVPATGTNNKPAAVNLRYHRIYIASR
jgi:hypothetical protein